jgi:hypothetical protein
MRAFTAMALATLIMSSAASADQIQCWRTDDLDLRSSPIMTADVLPKNTIGDVRFYKNESWAAMNVPGEVHGKVITNKNSPYPGFVEYREGIWLFLPKDLSSQNLAATARLAELNNRNSNAYLIVSNTDGEPRSVHLVCYSDIY